MVLGTKIKWYTHLNKNAPAFTNEWGCLVKVLDACLVDGYSEQQANKITIVGDHVTYTYPQQHLYQQYQILAISGASNAILNGEHCITEVSTDGLSLTIKYENLPSITENALLITTKLPSLGWTKVYTALNKAVYRFKLNSGGFNYYFVDDTFPGGNFVTTWGKYARVGLSEDYAGDFLPKGSTSPQNWSDFGAIPSGTETRMGANKILYATNTPFDAATYTPKTVVTIAGNRAWHLIGDETYHYLANAGVPNNPWYTLSGVGEYETIHQGFKSNSFLSTLYYPEQLTTNTISYLNSRWSGLYGTDSTCSRLLKSYTMDIEQTATPISYSGISYSGYNSIHDRAGPVNHFRVLLNSNKILLGSYKNLYWLSMVTPYNNLQVIKQGSNIYLALTMYVSSASIGQVVLKIGSKE